MAQNPKTPIVKFSQKKFRGIADYQKDEVTEADTFLFAKSLNYRHDPNALTLLPGAVKESGSVVTDLIKWGETIPTLTKYFFYGNVGNLYQRTNTPTWSLIHQVASSHGNGLGYFTGDDYLYYTGDMALGRYGPVSGTPQYSDNFLQAQGGIPTNTASIVLASASSMSADAADSASLSVTGNLTLETYFKANSLPTVGNSMTLVGKWDENANHRSYKMDIAAISGYFGNGQDSSLTIAVNTPDAPIDSACSGTAGTQALSATNASFAQGQVIFIHQTQGTNAGQWERNTIQGYTAGTITLGTPLLGSYSISGSNRAQVLVLKQYTNVTINSGITYTAKAWNGVSGGILAFLASGTVTVTGTISAAGGNGVLDATNNNGGTGGGFRGGTGRNAAPNVAGDQGEGYSGIGTESGNANGNGGGAGTLTGAPGAWPGAGGGNGTRGTDGGTGASTGVPGTGGAVAGAADLTTMVFGGGGGGGAKEAINNVGGGGAGGGAIFLTAVGITITGSLTANGGVGAGTALGNSGGGGAGGSILLKAQTATLGSGLIVANGGAGGGLAGTGGDGRVVLNYLTSYTGTTTPTLNPIQDNTLVTTTVYQARLGISNDGTAYEYLSQNLNNLTTGIWNRLSVAWTASTSTAQFYLNGLLLGTFVGTKTSINDNNSLLYVGTNKTTVLANYFNGLLNDMRIWNNVQTAAQIYANNQIQLLGSEAGLQAYYTFNSVYTDKTANTNTLTARNTPTFSTDVPYPAPTTRLDIDQSFTTTGQDYDLLTSISEASADTLTFTPTVDPQKSVDFNINAKGTGDWTVTVHDQQNNVITTATTTTANLPASGYYEFVFATPWRIVIGKTYHMHLTSTINDGSVVGSVDDNFSNADFHTYFGFLVTDTAYHPIAPFLNFMAVGNERYIAKWDGAFWSPNFIAFPPGWRVRCFGYWREYLAIGVWKGTNIYDYDFGRVYFWDGIAPTFNFYIDIGDGQVNALYGVDTDLYIMAGFRGYLLDYAGGYFYNTGNTKSNKLKRIPNNRDFAETDYAEVFPGAFRMWRNLLQIGMTGASNSTTIQRGVYSWGSYNQNYKDSLSYDFPISTGNYLNTVSIGCVYPVGNQLVIGWQDGIAFGADVIDYANPPAASGYIETMIQDDGTIYRNHLQSVARADHLALQSGQSVTIGYQADRSGSYNSSAVNTTTSLPQATFTKIAIDQATNFGRAREYQVRVTLTATGTTSPTLLGISLQGQPLGEENIF